jgi:hypothetical protein
MKAVCTALHSQAPLRVQRRPSPHQASTSASAGALLPRCAGTAKPREKLLVKDVQNLVGILYAAMLFTGQVNMMAVMPVLGYERVVFYRWVGCGPGSHQLALPAWMPSRRQEARGSCACSVLTAQWDLAVSTAPPAPAPPTRPPGPAPCRERSASMYNPFANGIALALVELPYIAAQAALFVCISYFMVGARAAHQQRTCRPRRCNMWSTAAQRGQGLLPLLCVHSRPAQSLRPQVGFVAGAEQFFFYMAMNLLCLWFYTVFGSFVVYITPNQQLGQVRAGHSCGGSSNTHARCRAGTVPL